MKTLVVLLGPTGVGKTALSFALAERLGSPILSADSRQLYAEIPIGTAAPTKEEQERVVAIVKEAMESAAQLSVPLISDAGIGTNWLEAH